MHPDVQDKMREAMKKMAILENARVRKTWGSHNAAAGTELARERGAKGGRPKEEKRLRPLTVKARMVNKMLQTGLNCVEIADVMDKSPEAIRDMKTRYDLPRNEDEGVPRD